MVDDDRVIEFLDDVLLRYIRRIYSAFFRWGLMSSLTRLIGFAQEYGLAKPKLAAALEIGSAFRHPPP